MSKRFRIGYKFNTKDEVLDNKSKYGGDSGRFWEHAIVEPMLEYELDVGDVAKAKAIGALIRLIVNDGKRMIKEYQHVDG